MNKHSSKCSFLLRTCYHTTLLYTWLTSNLYGVKLVNTCLSIIEMLRKKENDTYLYTQCLLPLYKK